MGKAGRERAMQYHFQPLSQQLGQAYTLTLRHPIAATNSST